MSTSYLPAKLDAYKAWIDNFSNLISAAPTTYGLVAGDAVSIAALVATFDAAYALSNSKSTRTPVTVNQTQVARNNASNTIRGYVRIILANAGVSDANKTALGLVIRDVHPSAIPAPGTAPVLGLTGATPGVLTLTFRDTGSSLKSRAKPSGVTSLELYCFFGTTAPASPAATPFLELHTRSPFAVNVPGDDVGKDAFFYGRWLNGKGQPGPWSALLTCGTI